MSESCVRKPKLGLGNGTKYKYLSKNSVSGVKECNIITPTQSKPFQNGQIQVVSKKELNNSWRVILN